MTLRAIAFFFAGAGALAQGAAGQAPATQAPPRADIRSGSMTASFYLPDAERGYYRGVRFDHGGVLYELHVAGHTLYRPWFSSVQPGIPDFVYRDGNIVAGLNSAMTGPAEEFQKPVGYEEAGPGETFVKVGVGLLRRIDGQKYSFTTPYPLVDGGRWTTTRTADSITFQQTFGSAAAAYGYVYTKTFRLAGNAQQLVIEHRFRNTGKRAIATTVYDHNFLTLDGAPVRAGYTLTVPYGIQSNRPVDPQFLAIGGNTITLRKDLQGEDRVMAGLQGFSGTAGEYDFLLQNTERHFAVRMVADRPLVNAALWAIRSVIAVEPFLAVEAAPGQELSWRYTYTYSDTAAAK